MLSPVMFTVGQSPVYWYGVLIAIAAVIGVALTSHLAKERNIPQEHILNLALIIIPSSVIGARLFHVAFSWDQYGGNLLEIFAIRHGGLAIHGAILAGILSGYLYVRKQKLDFWRLGDLIVPALALGQAIGRWGNFFNREAYGTPVTLEFISRFPAFIQRQMYIGGQYCHPAFLYESVCDFLIFIYLIYKNKRSEYPGQVFLSYLILYSIARFFIEAIRTDSFMLGGFRVAQITSVILLATAVWLMRIRSKKKEMEK